MLTLRYFLFHIDISIYSQDTKLLIIESRVPHFSLELHTIVKEEKNTS